MADLILHLSVIHQGYVDVLRRYQDKVGKTYLLGRDLIRNLSDYEPDIASLTPRTSRALLKRLGFSNLEVLTTAKIAKLRPKKLYLVNDDISRRLKKNYFPRAKTVWLRVFLRWDRKRVIASKLAKLPVSRNKLDQKFIKLAYQEAEKSSDWWRQAGAVLVKDRKVILKAYNRGLPSNHSPYLHGSIRDFLDVGESPELSPTIHAEQLIIARAAKKGLALKEALMYSTHFPCSVCAKLIVGSGISELFFSEGSSNLHALQVLRAARVKLKIVAV